MTGRRLLAPAALALGLVACSNNAAFAIDTSSIRPGIADRLGQVGLSLAAIDCPSSATPSADAPVNCTVTLGDGRQVGLEVGVIDDGGRQRLTWKLGPDLVPTDAMVAELTAFARSAVSEDLSVSCPAVVVLAGGNGRLTCDVTDANGQTGKLVVRVDAGRPVADHDRWSVDQS